jgi:hypothetical protein
MKAGGIGPSHSKRKTTCLIALQSLCPGAPRSAWVATVHIFGIFFFLFLFFLFFRPRGGGRVGHVEGQDPQGYVVLRCSFATWNACRRSESGEWPSPVFPNLSHTVDINPVSGAGSDRTIFPGAAGRYSSELIPWIRGLFLRLSPKVANGPYGRTL